MWVKQMSPAINRRCSSCKKTAQETEFFPSKGWYCKSCQTKYRRLKSYGITEEDFQRRLEEQGGLCKLCGVRKATHIDHDHQTKAVRGVLCNSCNAALGIFFESPERLRQAADYVEGKN